MQSEEILKNLRESIINGDEELAIQFVNDSIKAGLEAKLILSDAIIKGAEKIGELYQEGEYFLPDLMVAAEAMVSAMNILKPELFKSISDKASGTVLIGTVEGDVHSIGKSIVVSFLEGQGYNVVDLGEDVPPQKFVEEAMKTNPDVIGMSGLLTTSISKMHETVLMLKEQKIESKIVIGGGILSPESCEMVGADDFATDGWEGVQKIKSLIESKVRVGV